MFCYSEFDCHFCISVKAYPNRFILSKCLFCILLDPNKSGILFYEYVRIKRELERNNFMFWAFENVAGMDNFVKDEMTELVDQKMSY